MKNKLKFASILVIILFLQYCTEPLKSPLESTKMKQFDWILGNWYNHSSDGDFIENWNKINDSTFAGFSFLILNNDTLFSEKISLELKGEDVFYSASVNDQNQGKTVSFKLVSDTNNVFVFENKLHDFPQRIIYTNPLPDSIYARIEGIKNGKEHFEEFSFKRK